MGNLPIQEIGIQGARLYFIDALNGDEFQNDGNTIIIVVNNSGTSKTLTFKAQNTCNQDAYNDIIATIASGERSTIGTFSKEFYNNDNGRVEIEYSDITDIRIAVIKFKGEIDLSIARQTEILEQSFGTLGGTYIDDTDAHAGVFCAIQVLTNCVITLVGTISGITSVALAAGTVVYGRFTSVTLASGSVIAYNSGV